MSETKIEFKTMMCLVCGWIYSEKNGEPSANLLPGTLWEDIPESWTCPECGVGKQDFTMIEI